MSPFRGVSVLLFPPSPGPGPLAHAAEWAGRLHLPLRPVAPSGLFFRPHELCVFGGGLPGPVRRRLLDASLRAPQTSVLTPTADTAAHHVSRVLILNHRRRPGDGFLASAAALCRAFSAVPLLLTVAAAEAEAVGRERDAADALARLGLAADCDLAAGCDLAMAVGRAARWRRCSHVLVERTAPGWPQWLGGDVMRELANLPDALTVVAVPATAPLYREGTDNLSTDPGESR
jgi:hypothetical protein